MKQRDKQVAYISLVMKKALDQDLMREVFDLGGSVIDTGIIYCEKNSMRDKIERMLDGKKLEYFEVEYEPKRLFEGVEDPKLASMLLSLIIKKVHPTSVA
jgi:hypothetical protein